VQRLLAAQRKAPAKAPTKVTIVSGSGYWRAALRGELERLANTPQGGKRRHGRNHALNVAAFRLGQLKEHGAELEVVRDALTEVAKRIGLEPGEIGPTIASGWAAGVADPRRFP
jgi:hypothetical protein